MMHQTLERYTYHFPTHIRFGCGVVDEIGPHLAEAGFSQPLIVTDSVCSTLPFFQKVLNSLTTSGAQPCLFYDIHKNPLKQDVNKGVSAFLSNGCDAIIGVGGGAAIDVARAVALKAYHPGDLFDYDDAIGGDKKVTEPIPYFIAVPTTSGTGSEVGRSTVIGDDSTKVKKILFSPRLLARAVFADPELTLKLPPQVTATTGMDALTHHIEALFSKGFHPLCDGIAKEGIRLVLASLEEATDEGGIESRSQMMIAALMGAVAFQKGLGIVHSLAHPLSTMFDVHHGLANALMLPYGLAFNGTRCPEKYEQLCRIMNCSDPVGEIRALTKRLKLPQTLRELGITEEAVEPLAGLAIRDVCHTCNPVPVTETDFLNLYHEAL